MPRTPNDGSTSTGVASTMAGSSDDATSGLCTDARFDESGGSGWALYAGGSTTAASSSAGTIGATGAARTRGGCGGAGGIALDAAGVATTGDAGVAGGAVGGSGSSVSGANEIGAKAMSPVASPSVEEAAVEEAAVAASAGVAAGEPIVTALIDVSTGAGPASGDVAVGTGTSCSPVERSSSSDGVDVAPSTMDSHDMVGRRRERSPAGGTMVSLSAGFSSHLNDS